MAPNSTRKIICACIVFLLMTTLGIMIAVPVFVMPFVQNRLIPDLARKAGLPEVQCRIRRMGLNGADFGLITVGGEPSSTLKLNSVQIDYSLPGLLKKEIDRLLISDIVLYCDVKDNHFRLRGLDIESLLTADKQPPEASFSAPPVWIKTIAVSGATLVCQWGNTPFRLPCELQAMLSPDGDLTQGRLHLFPRGQTITITANTDLKRQSVQLTLTGQRIQTARFADLTCQLPGVTLAGKLDIEGAAEIRWNPFKVSSANARLAFLDRGSAVNHVRLLPHHPSNGEQLPITVSLHKAPQNTWRLHVNGVGVDTPLPVKLHDFNAAFTPNSDGIECEGHVTVTALKDTEATGRPFSIKQPLALKTGFTASCSNKGKWQFELKSPPDPPPPSGTGFSALLPENLSIACGNPTMTLTGQGRQTDGQFTGHLFIPSVKADTETSGIRIPILKLDTRSDVSWTQSRLMQQTDITMTALKPEISTASIKGKISALALNGQWKWASQTPHEFDGRLRITSGKLIHRETDSELQDITLDLPVIWPPVTAHRKGVLSVAAILHQKRNIGSLNGFLQQKDTRLIFGIDMRNRLLPDISMSAGGHASLGMPEPWRMECRAELSLPVDAPDIDWGKVWPALKGIETRGGLSAETALSVTPGKVAGSLKASVIDADLIYDDADLLIQGIDVDLFMPQLMPIRSAPARQLRFKRLDAGDLKLTRGEVDYEIENAHSFLIERCSFKWCNGNVNTQAFRIRPDIGDYKLTLYCDRLNLAMLLEQMGIGIADGQGTVNGRIPVRLHDDKITFDDAFLYSTPGHGGRIRLEKTNMLTTAVPEGTPQANQLKLVQEALKDFEYQWARVSLLTQDDHLLLKLQFDGKPARPLPFRYNKEFGGFAKVEANSPGSKFQGIRLDINFNLPLDQILQYKDIFRNMQLN